MNHRDLYANNAVEVAKFWAYKVLRTVLPKIRGKKNNQNREGSTSFLPSFISKNRSK